MSTQSEHLVDAAELRRKERISGRLSSMLTLRGREAAAP